MQYSIIGFPCLCDFLSLQCLLKPVVALDTIHTYPWSSPRNHFVVGKVHNCRELLQLCDLVPVSGVQPGIMLTLFARLSTPCSV